MANLNAWQKIDRVVPGKPFGDGADGSATVSTDPNIRATITGTATQTTGTAGSSAFANGDLVILHQTQGTGAGQWEVNKVASGGGSTSLTFQVAHNYTYGTGAQIIKVPRYTEATVSAHSVTAWNGSTGGVEIICGKTSITVSGALTGTGLGFRGSTTQPSPRVDSNRGEGLNGNWNVQGATTDSNYGAGGTYYGTYQGGGGDGGGNGMAGGGGGVHGSGGSTGGSADLITMAMAGGGGYGSYNDNSGGTPGAGGTAGSILILISASITISAGFSSNGNNGVNANTPSKSECGAGGGGAGGDILMIGQNVTLGTGNTTATGGTGGAGQSGNQNGGAGGVGRIAVHHSGTVTGTTNPTFTDVTDATLKERGGGILLAF